MNEIVFNLLKEKGLLDFNIGDTAYNEILLESDDSVIITANKLGLIMLADYLVEIALSEKKSDHLHLDERNFFDKANVELIIVKKEKI